MACLLVLIGNESNLGPILPSFRNFVQRKPLFAVPQPYFGHNFRAFSWSRSVMLGKSPRLTKHEIIFERCQLMCSGYLNVTDRQLAIAIPRSAVELYIL